MSSAIQAVLFDKKNWDPSQARSWLRTHNYKPAKRVHITTTKLRYRIRDPKRFKRFINKSTDKGVSLVIGFY